MGYLSTNRKKITVRTFLEMKAAGKRIAQLTAYDFTTARLIDEAGIDSILVGDSASNVMAGYADTLPITLDEMIYHARSVVRACRRSLVVCDMPFGTFQASREEAIGNAIRIVKESGVDALKLEGGSEIIDTVRGIIAAGIPVVSHLGLTPQSIHKFGGYGLRASTEDEARKLMNDALALDAAGVFAITLEKIPADLAAEVTRKVKAATIGIGAGSGTDGQVLVYADALGLTEEFSPRFLRRFADAGHCITQGVQSYIESVKMGDYPNESESY